MSNAKDAWIQSISGGTTRITNPVEPLTCAHCSSGYEFKNRADYIEHLRVKHGLDSTLTSNEPEHSFKLIQAQKPIFKHNELSPRRTPPRPGSKGSFDSGRRGSSIYAAAGSTHSRGSTPDEERRRLRISSKRSSNQRHSRKRSGSAQKLSLSRTHSDKKRGLRPEDVDSRLRKQPTLQSNESSQPQTQPSPHQTGVPAEISVHHAKQFSDVSTTPDAYQTPAPPASPQGTQGSQGSQRPARNPTTRPHNIGVSRPKTKEEWPDLVLQPESRQISQDQLAAEVRSIYTGLTMVETKCIHIDKAQAATPRSESKITDEHWQAMIALHRTLLHEHHDFFLASQHPSASPALKRLALKYSMPARMWKHGIHSFLELLRHHLPESLEYMLAFIYLAYQMMALLHETVESFRTTWVECLGDLGRYRMAVEDEDIRDRDTWAGVARSWYNKAADTNPNVGRLWHHLAILARPHMAQQLYLYNRSLTSVVPFMNARESIVTIFDPVLQTPEKLGLNKTDLWLLRIHALLFKKADLHLVQGLTSEYLDELSSSLAKNVRWRDAGVQTAIAMIGAIYGFGDQSNHVRLASDNSRKRLQLQDPSCVLPGLPEPQTVQDANSWPAMDELSYSAVDLASDLFLSTVRVAFSRYKNKEVLPFVNTVLTFVSHLYDLRSYSDEKIVVKLLDTLDWSTLAVYLNTLLYSEDNIDHKFPELILFDSENRQLPEDWMFRGSAWTFEFFPREWFKNAAETEEEQRYMEGLTSTTKARLDRVLSLGVHISRIGPHLEFNSNTKLFSAPGSQDMDIDEGYYSVAGDDSPEMQEANRDEELVKRPFQNGTSDKLDRKYSSIIADIDVLRDAKLFEAVRNLRLPVIIPEEAITELLMLEKERDVGSNEAAAALSNVRSAVHDFNSNIRIETEDGRDVTARHIESPHAFTTLDAGLKIDQAPKQFIQRRETLGKNIAGIAQREGNPSLISRRTETSFWSQASRQSTFTDMSIHTSGAKPDENVEMKASEQPAKPVDVARPLLISDNRIFRANAHDFGAAAISAWMLRKWIVQTRKHSTSTPAASTTSSATVQATSTTAMDIDTPTVPAQTTRL